MNALYTLETHGGYVSVYVNGQLFITDYDYLKIAQAVLQSATGDVNISDRAAPALLDFVRKNFPTSSGVFYLHDILQWHQAWEVANQFDDDNDGCLGNC